MKDLKFKQADSRLSGLCFTRCTTGPTFMQRNRIFVSSCLRVILFFVLSMDIIQADPIPLILRDSILETGIPQTIESPYAGYLMDQSARLSLAEVLDSTFTTRRTDHFHFRHQQKTLWVRFQIVNQSAKSQFIVELVNPFIPGLQLFQLNSAGIVKARWSTGVDSTFLKRPKKHRNFQFPVNIAPGDSAWFYVAVAQDFLPSFNLLITEKTERDDTQQRFEDILLTIFFVFCSLYLLLSAILFTVTRQHTEWFYFVYVLLTAFFIQGHMGLGYRFLWHDTPALQYFMPQLLNILRLVFGIQFFRLYFDLPRYDRSMNRFIDVTIAFFLLTPLLQVLYTLLRSKPDVAGPSLVYGHLIYFGYILFCAYLIFFSIVLLIWVLRELLYKRRRRASWLFLVLALNFIGLMTISLQYLGYHTIDIAANMLGSYGERTHTFFIPTTVMAAFFIEMVLVFYFSIRKYIRLFEKNQRAQLKLARAKEEGLQALILGVENERRRIARDLHDGACVNLAAIKMKLNALHEQNPESPCAAPMAGLADDLEQTYREVRGISHDLMSKSLEKTDLLTALEDLTARVQQAQPGLSIQLYVNFNTEDVAGMAKIQLYRIVQELLGNVLKHAKARHVTLQLLRDNGTILLSLEDDGKGFDPMQTEAASQGIGLANVRTRVAVLHGILHLESAPGRGTFIGIDIPETTVLTSSGL